MNTVDLVNMVEYRRGKFGRKKKRSLLGFAMMVGDRQLADWEAASDDETDIRELASMLSPVYYVEGKPYRLLMVFRSSISGRSSGKEWALDYRKKQEQKDATDSRTKTGRDTV